MGAAARELISRVRLAAEIPRKPVGDASIQPWELQYREFEFTSLRHVVSSAEKLLSFGPEIREKGRISRHFAMRTGPEKLTAELHLSHWSAFSPEPPLVVRFQDPVRANA
jgi:hypothetical protein